MSRSSLAKYVIDPHGGLANGRPSTGSQPMPFVAALPGVNTEQMEDWQERGETWHRLRFMSPDNIATHSRVQTLYVDETGILKRHNYDVNIAAGTAAAHYVSDYVEVRQHVSPTPPKRVSFAIAVY